MLLRFVFWLGLVLTIEGLAVLLHFDAGVMLGGAALAVAIRNEPTLQRSSR